MASTSQISASIHANRRRNSRLLLAFTLIGVSVVVVPGVFFVCQDSSQRNEFCHRLSTLTTGLGSSFSNLPDISKMFAGQSPSGSDLPVAHNEKSDKHKGQPVATARNIGVTAGNVKMIDEAVKMLEGQIAQNPKDASLHNRLGLIYAELGELGQAEAQFTQAIQIARTEIAEGRQSLEAKKAAGEFADASQLMLSNSKNALELSTAHSNLARVFEKLGQQSKVVAQLEQLNRDVRIGEGITGGVSGSSAMSPLAQGLAGSTKSDTVGKNKASMRVVEGMARAEALMQAHLLPQAMHEWKQIVEIDPTIAEAHEKLGTAALSSGNIALATQELKKAAQLIPGKASIHAALGICYQCRTRNKEAIDEFNKALALNPKDAQTSFNLGNAYAALGQNKDARRCYLQAIAIRPEMAVAHNNLATLYSLSGNYDQAIEQFEHTLSLAPNMASAHYGLGLAFYNKSEFDKAVREFKIALAINPALVDAHTKIELCHHRNNGQNQREVGFASGSGSGSGGSQMSMGSGGRRVRSASNVDEGRHRTLTMTNVNGDNVVAHRQRKVSLSSPIDEGSNRALVQRLN